MTRPVQICHYLVRRPLSSSQIVHRAIDNGPRLFSLPRHTPARGSWEVYVTKRLYSATNAVSDHSEPKLQSVTRNKLREYQKECIQAVLSHLNQGHKRLGISLATGSGKTVVFTHLIKRVPTDPVTAGDQTLILVHRRELVDQAAQKCREVHPDMVVEVEMGKDEASGHADITVASVASISSEKRLWKFDPARFKLVIVDEAHHIVASTYLKVLGHMGLTGEGTPKANSPALVGVSATFSRFDGLKLGAVIDHIVYHKDYVDMMNSGYLSNAIFTTIKSHVDLSKVKAPAFGDFALNALSKAVNTDETNDITVRSWLAKAKGRKSTLVFCVDINHVRCLTEKFRSHGIEAQYITGKDRAADRAQKLEEFRAGRFPVLLNCSVFTEGTDIPNIDCVLLARPTKSRNLLVQMIGRGTRLHPGKENCHVLDMVASLETGVVTVPTLFGLDPDELVNEATVESMEEMLKARQQGNNASNTTAQRGAPIGRVTFTDYDSVYDLISDNRADKHIRSLSQLAWVEVDDSKYILSNRYGGFISIESMASNVDPGPFDGTMIKPRKTTSEVSEAKMGYIIRYNEKVESVSAPKTGNWRAFKRTREIARAATLEDAVRAADT
jgi:ATP-dependent helicase IRC3